VENPLEAIARLAPEHPYAKIGGDAVVRAMVGFQRRVTEHGLTYLGDGRHQYRVLTAMGTLRLTGLTPLTMAVDPAQIDVVCSIGPYRNFSAGLVADGLSRLTKKNVRTLAFEVAQGELDAMGLAAKLAEPAESARFGDFLAREARGLTVAIPALLGLENAEEQKRSIESRFGGVLVEVPGLPPSIPGLRLMHALRRIALDRGVRIAQNVRAVGALDGGGVLRGVKVRVADLEREETADAVVLATGHLVTGGVVSTRGALREPVFDLPLSFPAGESFFRSRFLDRAGHPALSCGVIVDSSLRPLRDQSPVYENLFACGDILGGFDPYRERSGGGVALSTATVAGRLAAGVAR
jgi:glycerol-3-phosphate dehydrogenase subunit B